MLGLGEKIAEIEDVMRDLRAHDVDMLTLGQYLQPSKNHLPVARYVTPDEFDRLRVVGEQMGFSHVASGPMVRSSYHADLQAEHVLPARPCRCARRCGCHSPRCRSMASRPRAPPLRPIDSRRMGGGTGKR